MLLGAAAPSDPEELRQATMVAWVEAPVVVAVYGPSAFDAPSPPGGTNGDLLRAALRARGQVEKPFVMVRVYGAPPFDAHALPPAWGLGFLAGAPTVEVLRSDLLEGASRLTSAVRSILDASEKSKELFLFISYKREDLALTNRLAQHLRKIGLAVWTDQHILPHQPWEATMVSILECVAQQAGFSGADSMFQLIPGVGPLLTAGIRAVKLGDRELPEDEI